MAAREEERRTLRRDLHDGIGPTLAGITLQVDMARSRLADDEADARALLAKLQAETQTAVKDVRRVIEALRPPDLDELGLAGAIRRLEIECETSGDLDRLPAAVEVAAYRIVQEVRGSGACASSATARWRSRSPAAPTGWRGSRRCASARGSWAAAACSRIAREAGSACARACL